LTPRSAWISSLPITYVFQRSRVSMIPILDFSIDAWLRPAVPLASP
jgi:hypothetical protein